ncbi:hypothetical protein KR009_001386 [Drosophila setifemur]|nr:hypothetical protein KR009_001386 [Drosophila setifemur]
MTICDGIGELPGNIDTLKCIRLDVILTITTLVMCFFVLNLEARYFLRKHWYLSIAASGVIMIIHFMMCCCRTPFVCCPCKWILLVIYTAAHSIVVSYVASRYHPRMVLMAVGICALLVIALTLFAMFAPCDFTSCWVFIFILGIALLILGICAIIFRNRILTIVVMSLGVLVYSIYLVVDIQLMIGGRRHKNQYSEDQYILAAMSIYHDIVYLFIYILVLMGLIDD